MNSGGQGIPRAGLADALHFATGRASTSKQRILIANNTAGFAATAINAEEE
jgi:hypothetical protein